MQFKNQNSSLTYHPDLGWLVSWLMIDGQEILYCDQSSLTSSSIRWWIPTILPNPGVGNGILPRHGIARTAQFSISPDKGRWSKTGGVWVNILTLTLDRNPTTITTEQYQIFPYDFVYHLDYQLINNSCIITQQVTNPSSDHNLPMGIWLHPYFPTPNSIQQIQHGIESPFSGICCCSDMTIDHHNDDTAVLINPWTLVLDYDNYELYITYSDWYRWVWLRTPPGHDALCVEPVTHDVWVYFTDPLMIAPWDKISTSMQLFFVRK